jgi:hypothetical protein
VLSRADLLAVVQTHVEREVPRDVVRNQGELFVGLGLVPATFDYEPSMMRLLEAQLAGFYDPDDQTMYMASDLTEAAAEATLAHELVHALQDQYYDLGPRLAYRPDGNDRSSALQALAEGDATSAMMDVMLKRVDRSALDVPEDLFAADVEGSIDMPELGSVPRVLRASLVAPYVDGLAFVHSLRRAGGWAAVDGAWRDPPATTEQLLHLARYDAREPAENVPVPNVPATQWRAVYDDVFGEQGVRIAFEEWMPKRTAATAAESWGGDRAALFRIDGSRFAVAWRIRFDAGPGDPDRAAKRAFQALYHGIHGGEAGRHTTLCAKRRGSATLWVSRAGRDIVITVGPYSHDGQNVVTHVRCEQLGTWAADIVSAARR